MARNRKRTKQSRRRRRTSKDRYVPTKKDRFRSLPEEVICNILSFVDTKSAVQTSVLSSKFRNLWRHLDILNFHRNYFSSSQAFEYFIERRLAVPPIQNVPGIKRIYYYDNSYTLKGDPMRLERITEYVGTHAVDHLSMEIRSGPSEIPPGFRFPEVTVLFLKNVSVDLSNLFTSCPNLKDLTLYDSPARNEIVSDSGGGDDQYKMRVVKCKAEATKLEKIAISFARGREAKHCCYFRVELSAPLLTSLHIGGTCYGMEFTTPLNLLERVIVDYDLPTSTEERRRGKQLITDLAHMIPHFHKAKYVTLSAHTYQLFARTLEEGDLKPSTFHHLRTLTFKASRNPGESIRIPARMLSYFINSVPDAELVFE